jgi:hypothetical protein
LANKVVVKTLTRPSQCLLVAQIGINGPRMNDAFEGKAEGQRKTGYRGLAEVGGHRQ